jgi:hypothetical protein
MTLQDAIKDATVNDKPVDMPSHDTPQHAQARQNEIGRDPTREEKTPEFLPPKYTLGIDSAVIHFRQADVPRSKRTIERYCVSGELDCIKVKTSLNTDRWVINEDSMIDRINQFKQVIAMERAMSVHNTPGHDEPRHSATYNSMSGYNATERDMPHHVSHTNSQSSPPHTPTPPQNETKEHDEAQGREDRQRIEELQKELDDVKQKYQEALVRSEAHRIIEHEYTKQISKLQRQISKFSRVIGEVSTLLRLKAPDEDHERINALIDRAEEE